MTARLPSLRQPCTLGRALLFSSTKQDLDFSRKTKETTSDSEPAVSLRTRMNHRVASDRPDHAVTPFECRRRVAPAIENADPTFFLLSLAQGGEFFTGAHPSRKNYL